MAKLVDQWGQPIDLARLKEEQAAPTVTGVRQVVSGHPAQGLTPVRLARLLRDAEQGDPEAYFELAEEMEEKDLHYRGVISTRKQQVAQLEIAVESASDDRDDLYNADLVREWLRRDELTDEVFDILDAVGKGVSFTEIIWDTAGRQWLPARLEWRDPRWFTFDPDDGRTPLLRTVAGWEPLKPYGFIRHVHKSKSGLPIRGGLARPVAWYYLFKNFDVKDWVQFLEVFGQPLRVGKYSPGASEEDKKTLLRAVRNIASDAGAIIPEGMALEFIEAKISGNLDLFERFADWCDRQVSKAVLGQTGTTDTGQYVGTAQAHQEVREDIERADARQLAATLNRDLVRPMIDLNRGPQQAYPRLLIARPDEQDIDKLVGRVAKLVPMGLKVGASTMRDKLGLPDPDPDEETLVPPGQMGAPTLPERPEQRAAQAQAVAPPRDAVDDLVDRLEAVAAPAMDGLIDQLRELLDQVAAEAGTLRDVSERLMELYPDLDAGDLARLMAEAMTLAELEGRAEMLDA